MSNAQFQSMGQFFGEIGVRKEALSLATQRAFMEVARYHHVAKDELVLPFQDPDHVVFVANGIVREDRGIDTVRLWKAGAILGNWTGHPVYGVSSGITRSSTSLFHARAADVRRLIARHSDLGLYFARAEVMRAQDAEDVYGATRLGPTARVANLLLYLARSDDPVYRKEEGGGRTVIGIAPRKVVQGVTQRDMAGALALGLTTVEKVISRLRKKGVLNAQEPGTRLNRRFVILNLAELQHLAVADD